MKRVLFFVFLILGVLSIPVFGASYGWGFNRNSDNKTPDIGRYKNEIEGTNSYYVGDVNSKDIYLTFDAGYDTGHMEKILKILKEKEVLSTFFITGDFLVRQSELVMMIANDNHIVGNHTWGHKNITQLSKAQIEEQLYKVEEKYKEITNKEMIRVFRPPAGNFNKTSLNYIKDCGYATFFWSIAFKDWINDSRGRDYSYNNVINNLHNGAIILLHTVSDFNVEALPDIIDEIRARGYTIRNLDYLISSGN